MNFIYSICLFVTFSLSAFGLSTKTSGQWNDFYVGLSVVSGLVAVVFVAVAVFYNINVKTEARKLFNLLRDYKDRLKDRIADLERYKKELEGSLTKLYPDYEKELFKNMNPSDSEHLAAIMVKYPELKFNGVLTGYANGINIRLKNINDMEESINYTYREINNIDVDNWCFTRLNIPIDIIK